MKVRSTPLEWISVGTATSLFLGGLFMGLYSEPVWLNRFGSLIIAFGVLVAAIKLSDIFDDQIERFMAKEHSARVDQIIEASRGFFTGEPPPGFLQKVRQDLDQSVPKAFDEYKQRRLSRFKRIEVAVVVFGTLVNGFGDWVITNICGAVL